MPHEIPGQGGGTPARRYRNTRARRLGDAVMRVFVRAGVVPHTYLLRTRGRRTGMVRTTAATVVEQDGRKWLVAPYGPVSWVHNARTAGRVTLTRRGERQDYTVREVSATEAGPVLKRYVRIAGATRPYFAASPDSPVADFTAEADDHPVFELVPESADRA